MTKGASSMGKKSGKDVHIRCRRCGRASYHKIASVCSHCGFGGSKRLRSYSWQKVEKRSNFKSKNKK